MLRGVSERDIDLLVVEELVASPNFREWLAISAGLPAGQTLSSVSRSVVTSTGESDLEVSYCKDEIRTRLLVENKIDATFQRDQIRRYLERAQGYLTSGACERAATVLIAPDSYKDSGGAFDIVISYAMLRAWFANNAKGDERSLYKLHLIDAAIHRGTTGWVLVPSEAATRSGRSTGR